MNKKIMIIIIYLANNLSLNPSLGMTFKRVSLNIIMCLRKKLVNIWLSLGICVCIKYTYIYIYISEL